MKINIIIPTYKRKDKIIKCLASVYEAVENIQMEHNVFVYVYCSDKEDFDYLTEYFNVCRFIFIRWYPNYESSSIFWNDHIKDTNADIYFYLNDDVLLNPTCLRWAITAMKTNYPDLDGVIGLNQENLPQEATVKAAFGALGSTFVDRFKDKQVFCPVYKRFYLDKELELFSNKIGKFYWEEEAKLIHLHPAYDKKWHDITHDSVRTFLSRDKVTFNRRQRQNLLWGESYEI